MKEEDMSGRNWIGLLAGLIFAAMALTAIEAQGGMAAFWAFVGLCLVALLELGVFIKLSLTPELEAMVSDKAETLLLITAAVVGVLLVAGFVAAIVTAGFLWGIAASAIMVVLLAVVAVTAGPS